MERRVQCVDEQGDAFNDTKCAGVRPADQLQCNVLPCDFCSLTNCAGQVLTWTKLHDVMCTVIIHTHSAGAIQDVSVVTHRIALV